MNSNMNTNMNTTYTSTNINSAPTVERILMPTQIIEKPVAIHEEIRKEVIEEIQPVVNVEKVKTEIHQVTQPLFDKETRSVQIESRTLNTEVLPEMLVEGRGARLADDFSTTKYLDTNTIIVEKPALVNEVERKQIIEEIQPVIYKETIVPTVIQETKPIYQKVVEGAVYSQETLASRGVRSEDEMRLEAERNAYIPSTTVIAPTKERVMLPTQIVEKPVAVHESIRKETIEEIQPIVNVEKIKTEIHQVTAPLFDKEVRPVLVEKKVLNREILPEVHTEGRGFSAAQDTSSTRYLDTHSVLVEKPAIFNEVERTQVIEEIQPVLYKETIVPTVIRETKPMFQKVVEGPVYTHETLAPRSLKDTNFQYPMSSAPIEVPASVPVVLREVEPVREVFVEQPRTVVVPVSTIPSQQRIVVEQSAPLVLPVQEHHRKEIITDTVTTTTTSTTASSIGTVPATHNTTTNEKHHRGIGGLFHRHSKDGAHDAHNVQSQSHLDSSRGFNSNQPLVNGAPLHSHTEKVLPNGQKVVEDTTVVSTHSQTILPTTRAL